MITPYIVLIGLGEYENLGLEYIAAILEKNGFRTKIVDISIRESAIYRIIKKYDPILIGFSIIYLQYSGEFKSLINFLRNKEIRCHFTAGGHYASLRYNELLREIPALDSIVRFEGENTTLDLATCIAEGKDWQRTKGISFLIDKKIVSNPLRNFESDLDKFPFPKRAHLKEYALWRKFASIIAGRGCVHNCSFCNTRKFYSNPSGNIKRIRRPEMVVKEMELLYHNYNCEVFLFLDDDFPVSLHNGDDWIKRFCRELDIAGLTHKVMWKISCRADEVEENLFGLMKKHGLFSVFIGIEDGTDEGLRNLNKCTTSDCNLKAVSVIKRLNLRLDFGFLLFTPYTTFENLKANLDFLRLLCYDGYTPVTFYKMIPYYDTFIEKKLQNEGRLKITDDVGDYDFIDKSLDLYFHFIADCFSFWLWDPEGLANTARWAADYVSIYNYYYLKHSFTVYKIRRIRKIITESNIFILDRMRDLVLFFENRLYKMHGEDFLIEYKESIKVYHGYYKEQISSTLADLTDYTQFQYLGNLLR